MTRMTGRRRGGCTTSHRVRSSTVVADHRTFAHGRAVEDVAVGRDERREAGRCRLHHPATGLEGAQPARGDLLGLHDRARVARSVRRVEDDAGALADTVAGPAAEEHLPRDDDAETCAVGQVEVRRVGAGDGVVGDLVDGGAERVEQSAQRHVLAERHAADLVVAARHLAVGSDDHLGVGEPVVLAGHVLGDADRDRHAEAGRLAGDGGELGLPANSVTSTTFSGHSTRSSSSSGVDRTGRVEVALGDDGARHVVGARALLAAALHGGDVEELPGAVAAWCDDADRRDGGGGEQSGDGQAHVGGGARRDAAPARRGRSRPGTRPT